MIYIVEHSSHLVNNLPLSSEGGGILIQQQRGSGKEGEGHVAWLSVLDLQTLSLFTFLG